MRRIIIFALAAIVGIIISFITIAGFYFIATVMFLTADSEDITITPVFSNCENRIFITVSHQSIIRFGDEIIDKKDIKQTLDNLKAVTPDACITVFGKIDFDLQQLEEIDDYATEISLESRIVTISEKK